MYLDMPHNNKGGERPGKLYGMGGASCEDDGELKIGCATSEGRPDSVE
jgi:hypothetical protein